MSAKEDSSSAAGVFALLYFIFHLITVVAYFDYHVYSTFGRWFWGLVLMFIPLINSFFAFWGLIDYWDMNWISALVLVIAINLAAIAVFSNKQNQSATAIGSTIIIAIIMTACFWFCPKVADIETYKKESERDFQAFNVNLENGRMSMLSAKEEVKDLLKKYRIRAKRAGYAGYYDAIGLILKD